MKTYQQVFVHYDQNGEIKQVSEGAWPHEREGLSCAIVLGMTVREVIGAIYRVDLESVGMGEDGWNRAKLIKVGEHDTRLTRDDMMGLRNQELMATDQYMVEDRPLAPQEKQAWKDYRRTLRDLGQIESVAAIKAAWPNRPNGSDAIAHVREKD